MSLVIITGPTAEPVTLAEVKTRLRLTDTTDDALITTQITAAREYAEKMTRRSLNYKTYAAFFDSFPDCGKPIRIPVPPLIAVTAVKYLDSTLTLQTWDPTEYYVAAQQSPALIVPTPANIYPCPASVPGCVEVDFTAGYGYPGQTTPTTIPAGPVCPENLKEGIRQLAVYIYENPSVINSEGLREAPLSFRSFFDANKVWVF
jgi:uncharacterized phiE125 gp8 family phage protein